MSYQNVKAQSLVHLWSPALGHLRAATSRALTHSLDYLVVALR